MTLPFFVMLTSCSGILTLSGFWKSTPSFHQAQPAKVPSIQHIVSVGREVFVPHHLADDDVMVTCAKVTRSGYNAFSLRRAGGDSQQDGGGSKLAAEVAFS